MVDHYEGQDQPLMTDPERRETPAGNDAGVNDAGGEDASGNDVPPANSQNQHRQHSDSQRGLRPRTDLTAAGHPDAPLGAADDDDNDGTLQLQDDSDPPTPRFLQDENAWKRWRWVPYPVRRALRALGKWSVGPPNPQPYRIKPLFPLVQEYPLFLADKLLATPKRRFWLLLLFFSAWITSFVLVKRQGEMATEIAGWGQPRTIGCGATYWGSGNTCGVDGNSCRPFEGGGFAFRCPANCASYQVLNPHAVGDQEVVYRPIVVGGPPSLDAAPENATYRGDSYICGAAIHAGVVSNANGGCGVVRLVGARRGYRSTRRNGITSVGFDSHFPLSFQFLPGIQCGGSGGGGAQDARWSLLAISVVFTALLSLFTASPAWFFFPCFTGIFWTVGMALDPPPHRSVAALFSNISGKFLPAMFVAWVVYDRMGVRRALAGLTAQVEKTVLWLGACWVGALDNYTLSFIPIQRLSAHDLQQQPGAKAALAAVIVVLVAAAAAQAWFLRQEARFVGLAKLYALLLLGIVVALVLPGLQLRLHHYVLALLLLPGTGLQTRPSLLYQGLLVGLLVNGVARWGFDPVLQTPAALRGDAHKGTPLPVVGAPVVDASNATISLTWEKPQLVQYDGISVLVNDVERFRTYFADADARDAFVWSRSKTLGLPEYFRFAFMDGSESGDYTRAGVWTADGQWVDMKPGPSRRRAGGRGLDDLVER
ncbi:hypothetical protein UVI_02021680 [Ustilaginoidea virens]|uniref:LCCL domain-containing protein n=1 Tax=Ustilaginoidea virens TaxID=1159556 RepID=A0A1B5L4W4_USTVR|nr:hypothetical protein UVI_02021680 [Ustilaginoidea virens]